MGEFVAGFVLGILTPLIIWLQIDTMWHIWRMFYPKRNWLYLERKGGELSDYLANPKGNRLHKAIARFHLKKIDQTLQQMKND